MPVLVHERVQRRNFWCLQVVGAARICAPEEEIAAGPESVTPNRANRARPSRSTTASRSSTKVSSEKSAPFCSDRPVPLLSKRTNWRFSAKRSYQLLIAGICHSSWMWLHGGLGMLTKGMPSPNVQKAMFTPSLVFAYWIRGSIAAPYRRPALLFYAIGA